MILETVEFRPSYWLKFIQFFDKQDKIRYPQQLGKFTDE